MELTVKLVSGEVRTVQVHASARVSELKHTVAQVFSVDASRVRLSTNTVTLDKELALLSSYGLSSGSSVMVLLLASFQVFVKNEKGQVKTYDVTEKETVAELQQKIYNKERTPVDQQRLIYAGRQLEVGCKLKDYGITSESTIHMTLRLRGG